MLVPELIAIFIFTVVVVFGLIILTQVWQNKPTPKLTVVCHGFGALIGLGILWVLIFNGDQSQKLLASAVLFTIATVDGICLSCLDCYKKYVPKVWALLHAVVAITALIILILYVLY